MKTKKLLALLMAGAMSVSMLSGCGGSAPRPTTRVPMRLTPRLPLRAMWIM